MYSLRICSKKIHNEGRRRVKGCFWAMCDSACSVCPNDQFPKYFHTCLRAEKYASIPERYQVHRTADAAAKTRESIEVVPRKPSACSRAASRERRAVCQPAAGDAWERRRRTRRGPRHRRPAGGRRRPGAAVRLLRGAALGPRREPRRREAQQACESPASSLKPVLFWQTTC